MTGEIPAYLLRSLRPGQAEPLAPTGLQLRQIEFVHHVLEEADAIAFEERLERFKRDRHPERVLSRWVSIAQAYREYCQKHELSGDARKEVYRVLVVRSKASKQEALDQLELAKLSNDNAVEVIDFFDAMTNYTSWLSWLVGDRITAADLSTDPDAWELSFESRATLRFQCLWRLLDDGVLCLTSEDHGHQFGLPRPVDCVATLRALAAYPISSIHVREGTADLILGFGTQFTLEVLAVSGGYESWHLSHPVQGSFVGCGAGRVNGF